MTLDKGAGFSADGSRYVIKDVNFVDKADHVLWNDRMSAHVDHKGEFAASFLQPGGCVYAMPDRRFYIKDEKTDKSWIAPYDAIQDQPDSYECSIGVGDIAWKIENDGIEFNARAAIPKDDILEMWTISLKNTTRRKRQISFYTCFPVGARNWFSAEGEFDRKLGGLVYTYFPYYVKWQDHAGLENLNNTIFCLADKRPTSQNIRLSDFLGAKGYHGPAGIESKTLSNPDRAVIETCGGIYQYRLTLAPGKSWTGNFILGGAKDKREVAKMKKKYLSPGGVDKAVQGWYKFLDKHAPAVQIDTPDTELNHFVNNWLPVQTLRIGRRLRHGTNASARNAMVDAVGATYTDPAQIGKWFPVVFAEQEDSGYTPHGIPLFKGVPITGINQIRHRDANVWAPPLLLDYIGETGDMAVLDMKVSWKQKKKASTLYDHICCGMDWQLKDRSKRGLSHVGEGDWNDPLNMAGRKGKGESVWLTQALIHALKSWVKICDERGDKKSAAKYAKAADRCAKAVNKYGWDGEWYMRGTTDAGKPFGSKKNREGRIYLNPQGWAMTAGIASKARIAKSVKAAKKHLQTKQGMLMLAPAYTKFHDDIGKLSMKIDGMEENGSVYCHAALFYSQGLYAARLAEDAYDAFRIILPGYKANTVKRSGQIPIYVSNYFRGPAVGLTEGKGSHESTTGSAPWFYRIAIAMLMGVRGEFDGLRIDPQLPKKWKGAKAWRKFRGAEFNIVMKRKKGVTKTTVLLDGKKIRGTLIPIQKPRTKHQVEVLLPA